MSTPRAQAPTRREQAGREKAPRSADYPIGTRAAQSYNLRDIPEFILTPFDVRASAAGRSRRWTILRLMEQYSKGKVTL